MNLIEAIKQNNQTEFFRLLTLKTGNFGRRIIDENDGECGGNPLHIAVAYGHLRFVEPLIKAGIKINEKDDDGLAPIHIAAENGHENIITALWAGGADVDMPNSDGVTPIHTAVKNGNSVVAMVLKRAGANMDSPDRDGFTPIFIAVEMGDLIIITTLLEAGADASIKTPQGTPLEQAKRSKEPGCPEIVRLLEAHLKQYPNGIRPVRVSEKELIFPLKPFAPVEQKNPPILTMLARLNQPNDKPTYNAGQNMKNTAQEKGKSKVV
jgi:ankyrin repeat protein